ncbi:hypothetical protein [Glaciecola sp. 1036]|uniref:hypothetical protein n=1 Tax=Alteromonadaceae TaxID=72275 RepID=UPI003CFD9579
MEGTTFVLLLLFCFVLPITMYSIWTGHKKEMLKLKAKNGGVEVQAMEAEIVTIKKRLAALEAIVTDEKYQLNKAFDDLNKDD